MSALLYQSRTFKVEDATSGLVMPTAKQSGRPDSNRIWGLLWGVSARIYWA
jgi:hypothetical protein